MATNTPSFKDVMSAWINETITEKEYYNYISKGIVPKLFQTNAGDVGHQLTEKKLEKLEKNIAKEYKTAVKEMKQKYLDYTKQTEKARQVQEKLYKDGKISFNDFVDWQFSHQATGRQYEEMIDVLAADMVQANNIAKGIIKGEMPDIFALNCNFATYNIEHGAGIDTSFVLYNHDTAMYLLGDQRQLMPKPSPKKAKEIAANKDMQWNKQKIQSAVLQGVLQGESPYEVAERLQQVGQMNYNSAVRYARTMGTSAQNAGRYEAFHRAKKLGVDLTIEWSATLDHRTRHSHRNMHGQRHDVDEPFIIIDGGKQYTIYYPADCTGASTAPQKEIWNCRCTLLSWVKGYEGDTVKESPKIKDMTFEEWQNEKKQVSPATGIVTETVKSKEPVQKPVAVQPPSLTNSQEEYKMEKQRVLKQAQEYSWREHEADNFDQAGWDALPKEESNGIYRYTGSGYRKMNAGLRGKDRWNNTVIPDGDTMNLINGCEKGLGRFALKNDTVLYRGMGDVETLANVMGLSKHELNEAIADGSIIGARFCERGFCSTGVSRKAGWTKPVQMKIYTPKGTSGFYVDPVSMNRGEKELLLQHHTWFEIMEAKYDDHGFLQLRVYAYKQTPEDFVGELAKRRGTI